MLQNINTPTSPTFTNGAEVQRFVEEFDAMMTGLEMRKTKCEQAEAEKLEESDPESDAPEADLVDRAHRCLSAESNLSDYSVILESPYVHSLESQGEIATAGPNESASLLEDTQPDVAANVEIESLPSMYEEGPVPFVAHPKQAPNLNDVSEFREKHPVLLPLIRDRAKDVEGDEDDVPELVPMSEDDEDDIPGFVSITDPLPMWAFNALSLDEKPLVLSVQAAAHTNLSFSKQVAEKVDADEDDEMPALEQQIGAMTVGRNPSTPIASAFWLQFPGFVPQPKASFKSEFTRLAKSQSWSKETQQKCRIVALVSEFSHHYGTCMTSLEHWQQVCRDVGIDEVPGTITKCRKALKPIRVNLFNLLNHKRDPMIQLRRFKNHGEFVKYTHNRRTFPKDCAKQEGFIKVLLKKI